MGETLTFVTSNAAKAEQLGRHLEIDVVHQKLDVPEIQGLDLSQIVEQKAREAYKVVGTPVIVEDMALVCHAMGRLPGPLIKWFFEELGADGLCHQLDSYDDRSATAMVLFGLYDGETLSTYAGGMKGSIAESPRGESGFPTDTIFIPHGYERTWAEMSDEDQTATSIRRVALKKMEAALKTKSVL